MLSQSDNRKKKAVRRIAQSRPKKDSRMNGVNCLSQGNIISNKYVGVKYIDVTSPLGQRNNRGRKL